MIIIARFMLLALLFSFLANTSQMVFAKGSDEVQEACKVTRYQNLCIHSLSQFSNTSGRSPSKWARASVSVTIEEVKNVQTYLQKLNRNMSMRGRNRIALSDCIESFADAIDELHKSLGVLRNLSKSIFSTQMGNLNTWISAALTSEDTCIDGFEGQSEIQIKLLRNRVRNVSCITSNALALVNKLATTGIGSITDP
ncbi:hypothetical protein TanjilG_14529 [Lupinus angustifolius]|uniref:Pectinesterase inhibitor domain-containing protein n=1 Tax=Lupinus angustifolius TaxID=3871 RepID=A0A1J7G4V6_LUPAN|nr:PREDICTED: 21 kDa protein-like [Lupinus angustifolius]OIV95375.1 hypothetical protein TanjilG_14529 [Lupinus angustifolius]